MASFPPSPHYGFSLDTTSPVLGLAIGPLQGAHRCHCEALGHGLSAQLHEILQGFLVPQQWSELAWIAVMQGPGSFTGTRIGVVTARTLAQQLRIPLYGFSNLAIAAWTASTGMESTQTVAVTIPGQRGFVYGAIYEVNQQNWQLQAIEGDRLLAIEDWQAVLERYQLDLSVKQETQTMSVSDIQLGVEVMLDLGWHLRNQNQVSPWETVLPYYG
jgi:tRNA threonylcarbamoyl adenosine modification protein YeaZ